jgi:hypothetical protein
MMVHGFKTLARCFCSALLAIACLGCSQRPKVIEASPEQQKKWQEEEDAAREKKLQDARAAGQVVE